MANTSVRLNLSSALFPFYTEAAGRTIMMPENDENFDRYNAANTSPDKGVPQVYYMHNIMPVSGGFQSIGYIQQIAGLANNTTFDNLFSLYNADSSNFFLVPSGGINHIYDGDTGAWSTSSFPVNAVPENVLVTTAYVKGVTYIFYEQYGCFTYNETTKQLVPVTLTGLTVTGLLGICSANGYLVAWDSYNIFYSSITEPTNFIPNIQNGAGGGALQEAKGKINICTSIAGGFLIYCDKNIVGASYTANVGFPYIFAEVAGSGGVTSISNIAYQSNLQFQVAYTTAGMQQITLSAAVHTLPEVSDFLAASIFEDFNETTKTFSSSYTPTPIRIKLNYIGDKFIVISYGVAAGIYTHALIYDYSLNRFGKVKITHSCAFNFSAPAPYNNITYGQLTSTTVNSLVGFSYSDFKTTIQKPTANKQNLAFLQSNGTVQLVDFSLNSSRSSGVFIIGKLQFRRNYMFVHQYSQIESVLAASTFDCYLIPYLNGKDPSPAIATTKMNVGNLVTTYAKRVTATNVSLLLIGTMNLTSIIVTFTVGGSR
jgi:hypothetical protein